MIPFGFSVECMEICFPFFSLFFNNYVALGVMVLIVHKIVEKKKEMENGACEITCF